MKWMQHLYEAQVAYLFSAKWKKDTNEDAIFYLITKCIKAQD
jgi:hypothetical protein